MRVEQIQRDSIFTHGKHYPTLVRVVESTGMNSDGVSIITLRGIAVVNDRRIAVVKIIQWAGDDIEVSSWWPVGRL